MTTIVVYDGGRNLPRFCATHLQTGAIRPQSHGDTEKIFSLCLRASVAEDGVFSSLLVPSSDNIEMFDVQAGVCLD